MLKSYDAVDGEDLWTAVGNTSQLRILVLIFTVRSERFRVVTGLRLTSEQRSSISWKEDLNKSMPVKKLVVPAFRDDKEEAAWWEKHRAEVEAGLRAAMRAGKTLSLKQVLAQAQRKKELQTVTIRLASEDIATARQLADDKGIGYQTYIKVLLHEALGKEARLAKR